jgi:hypothetical protein
MVSNRDADGAPSSIIRRYGVHITQVLGISPPVKVLTELGFAVAKYVLPSKSSSNRDGERSNGRLCHLIAILKEVSERATGFVCAINGR